MRWDRNYESSNVEDRRSEGGAGLGGLGGGGGGLPLWSILAVAGRFGWKGVLVALIVVGGLMYGGNLCTGSGGTDRAVDQQPAATGQDQGELEHFVGFVLDDVNHTWRDQLPGYQDAHLVLFRNAIRSACGTATTAVGPFYCQLDHKVYIDLGFYDELRRRFGAPGEFAQAYVIAHEVGHHVQNQIGIMDKVDALRGRGGEAQANALSVRVELQADCFAGVWAARSQKENGWRLDPGDIEAALNAAAQIGDDAIQKRTQGYVVPESFTHGTSAQRVNWFKRGVEGGSIDRCNTFEGRDL